MSNHHLHVPSGSFSPQQRPRYRQNSPFAEEEGLEPHFSFESAQVPSLLDIDVRNGVRTYPAAPVATSVAASAATASAEASIMSAQEELARMAELNANQQRQMDAANIFANKQTEQLLESRRQLELAQQQISKLTEAFESLSTQQPQQPRPLTLTQAPKKKPELPPFDGKNILIWIRRIEAAYVRVGVTEAKDKFAWLESMFQVKMDPTIDAFLYGTNTEDDWTEFITYLKKQYGPTQRQKAQKLLADIPRHDLKPSQFFKQLVEDTKDVKVDDIRKEHLLRSIPPRIREIMGKEVEGMTGQEVADAADSFFDRQGKPLEKMANPISHISNTLSTSSNTSSSASASSFTPSFGDDEETEVNFVRRGGGGGGGGGGGQHRSRSRNPRSRSRPNFGRNSSNGPSTQQHQQNDSKQSFAPGTCRFHRRFGEKTLKCVSDCPLFSSFKAKQGNGQGGRRQ